MAFIKYQYTDDYLLTLSEIILSFLISCTAGIICHYICKWLAEINRTTLAWWLLVHFVKTRRKPWELPLPGLSFLLFLPD
ncbi:hypothetical protein DWY47_13075 [Ruminococcus sp. AF25-23LB]|nr:hypothetical protein DWY47_13075 [Ruminococcus sp. AF25-23LB]